MTRESQSSSILLRTSRRDRRTIAVELVFTGVCLLILVTQLWRPLILGDTTYGHDNYYWNLPLFKFFTEQMGRGTLPLWNPFSHGGEPFYPLLGAIRALDPSAIFFSSLVRIFTNNSALVYNWTKILQVLFFGLGAYLLLRSVARYLITRLMLIPVFFLSAYVTGPLRQDGLLSQFSWAPFAVLIFLRIFFLRRYSWTNFFLFGALVGLGWQTYHFVALHYVLLLFFLGTFFFHRRRMTRFFYSPHAYAKVALFFLPLSLMMGPNLVVLLESDRFVFPPRMVEQNYSDTNVLGAPLQYEGGPENIPKGSLQLSYSMIKYSGSFGTIADFVQMASPRSNAYYGSSDGRRWELFIQNSEASLYIGIIGWLAAMIGLSFGQHVFRRLALLIFGGTALYFLGGNIHYLKALHFLFPPAWFLRHSHLLQAYVICSFLFFQILGVDYVVRNFIVKRGRLDLRWTKSRLQALWIFGSILVSTFFIRKIVDLRWAHEYGIYLTDFCVFVLAGLFAFRRKYNLSFWMFSWLVASQIFAGLYFSMDRWSSFLTITAYLVIPVWLFHLFYRQSKFGLALATLLLFSIFELSSDVDLSRELFENKPTLTYASTHDLASMKYERPEFARMVRRPIGCVPHSNMVTIQQVRYPELYLRTPTVFSPVYPKYDVGECTLLASNSPLNERAVLKSALEEKRWNSFLLPDRYFKFLHSSWPKGLMYDWFLVGKTPVRFFSSFLTLNSKDEEHFRADLGEEKFSELFRHRFFVPGQADERPSEAYERATSEVNEGEVEFTVLNYDYNSLSLTVRAPKPTYLYWADGFDIYWRAKVNGKEAKILPANNLFKAVFLGSGQSEVHFFYRPVPFLWALFIFYLCFLSAILFALARKVFDRWPDSIAANRLSSAKI